MMVMDLRIMIDKYLYGGMFNAKPYGFIWKPGKAPSDFYPVTYFSLKLILSYQLKNNL